MGIDKILSDFGQKVYDFFIKNSDEGDTILFVVDNDKYSTFFSAEEEKKNFEKAIKSYVNKNGLSLYNDYIAIALASQQVLLAYEKIKDYIQNDTDKAINSVISEFYEFENSSQLYNYYYHRLTDNDNENLWKRVQEIFEAKKRIIKLPGTETGNDANHKYVKYPEEQIKFYKTFKSEDFNTLFSNWFNACYENINQIESDPECEELIEKRFSNSNVNKQTILPILWSYYSSWKKNTKLSDDDKGLYIELNDYDHTFKIAGDVFNRKRNRINPEEKRLYKVFIRESTNWWIGAKDDIPEDGEFVLLIDINFKDNFPNANLTEYKYIEEECDYIVFRYSKRPDNFASDFPSNPQLKGGVRLHNNQYLDIPWLLPQCKKCKNGEEIKYTKVLPKDNLNETSLLKPILNNIDGLQIKQLEDSNTFSYDETESKSFVEKSIVNGNDCSNKLTEKPLPAPEEAVLKCQQALFLWLATKGKASHLSIHNICLNIIENFEDLEKMDTEYPEYYILQPLFKAGVIELYKTEEGKYYYALSRGGFFPTDKENAANVHSYWSYNKSVENSTEKVGAFLNSLQSLENSFYREKALFEKWDGSNSLSSSAFIKYSSKYFWSSKSYETKLSEIYKIPSIFKISNKVYSPTYFCDSNGSSFKLKDDFANPWYPLSWNICESYIDLKKGKVIFEYDKKNKKLLCKDFTALPIYFARALVCNNPEKLEEPSFWLSYFDSKYKTQVFNNVSEKLYKILKNKYLEKCDTEILFIKTNAQLKSFSFNNVSDYQLPSKDSYRIFRYKVDNKGFSCWQSDVDTLAIPVNRPFGLLIDSAFGGTYITRTNARFYYNKSENSNLLFVIYNRLPNDFFDKLRYFKIPKSESDNQLLSLPDNKRNELNVNLINGIIPDYRNINGQVLEAINKQYSFTLNEKGELSVLDSQKYVKVEKVKKLVPGKGYITVLHKNRRAFTNIKLGQVVCEHTLRHPALETIFKLQESLYKWLENIGYATISEIHEFLMSELEKETDEKIYSFYSINPEEKILNPLLHCGIIDCRYSQNKEEEGIICYTLSLKEQSSLVMNMGKILRFDLNHFKFDYQKHFAGGNEEQLDNNKIVIYLFSLLYDISNPDSPNKVNYNKIRSFFNNEELSQKLTFTYDEEQKLLNCSNMNILPWQLGRALIMIDSSKLYDEEIYLCGCKDYKSCYFKIGNIYYLYILDEIISALKQEKC